MFFNAIEGIYSHLDDIEPAFVDFNLHYKHPAVRAAGRIRGQLNRLHDSYRFLDEELGEAGRELAQFAARDDDFRRDLEEAGAIDFKLKCAKHDLAEEVEKLRSAAGKPDTKLEELKREMEDLRGTHDRLLEAHRSLHETIAKEGAEKLLLEGDLQKRNGDLGEATKENSRLQAVVEERDEDIRELKASGVELETLAEQRQREIAEAKEERIRLQDLIREKEARISLLTTQPITPVSPLAAWQGGQGGQFPLPSGSAFPMPRLEATQPSPAGRETSPAP
ncbi:hypothetical protein B0J18DRAFT_70402 [Chaetomium sp. MPI-SDFR-AT-0129]|nr:hypothetical protein B0J18DRAFT_70402 [Chaetomium sp. MPI-SDFR-AT-0129]